MELDQLLPAVESGCCRLLPATATHASPSPYLRGVGAGNWRQNRGAAYQGQDPPSQMSLCHVVVDAVRAGEEPIQTGQI